MNEYIEVGKRVREARKIKKLNRNELAEILDLSPYFIGHIERW